MRKIKSSSAKNIFPSKLTITTIILLLTIFTILTISKDQISGKIVEEISVEEPLTEPEIDFISTEGGTFNGMSTGKYYKDPIDNVVVLFASAKIQGLTLIYYPHENLLVGGTPQLRVENVVLFDDNQHLVQYSFARNGKQQLYYDGQLKAESDFMLMSDSITGAVVGVDESFVSESLYNVEIN